MEIRKEPMSRADNSDPNVIASIDTPIAVLCETASEETIGDIKAKLQQCPTVQHIVDDLARMIILSASLGQTINLAEMIYSHIALGYTLGTAAESSKLDNDELERLASLADDRIPGCGE